MVEHPRKLDYLNAYSLHYGHYMSYWLSRSHRTNGASRPVTPYDRWEAWSSNINCTSTRSFMTSTDEVNEIIGRAYTKAYDDLAEELVGESSSLGVAAAEMGETVSMIANRLEDVVRFAKAVKSRDMRKVATFLRSDYQMEQAAKFESWASNLKKFKRPRSSFIASRERYIERYQKFKLQSRKRDLKSTGGLWLEHWLGWAPTFGDVQTTLDVLAHDFPYERVNTRARGYRRHLTDRNGDNYLGGSLLKWEADARASAKITTMAKVSNPNAYLRNRLGLNNVLDIAWQVVPLSFLFDWKLGISDHLQRFTALDGVELLNTSIATKFRWAASGRILVRPEIPQPYGPYEFKDNEYIFYRDVGSVPVPPYYPNELQGLSVTRGATAISLILQLIKD